MTQEMVITKVPSRSVFCSDRCWFSPGSGHVCCRRCYVTKCIHPAAGEAFKRPLKYGLLVSTPLKNVPYILVRYIVKKDFLRGEKAVLPKCPYTKWPLYCGLVNKEKEANPSVKMENVSPS